LFDKEKTTKQKISPKGDSSGLFYLTMLRTEAEDYT